MVPLFHGEAGNGFPLLFWFFVDSNYSPKTPEQKEGGSKWMAQQACTYSDTLNYPTPATPLLRL